MKNLLLILSIAFIASCNQKRTTVETNSINPIIGNISYTEKHGESPSAASDEQERVQIHLTYVENVLRKKSTAHLTDEQRTTRNTLLDHLKNYALAGQFPKNNDYPDERRPCFIDQEGNICAVGYLVEQSAGLDAAQEINALFQYATIQEMKSARLNDWIANSGLSRNEVAMIQPTYSSNQPDEYVGYDYAVPSAVLNFANLGLNTASLANWNNTNYNVQYARLGLVSGALTLGFNSFYSVATFRTIKTDYQKKLSNFNFASGLLTMGINSFRIPRQQKTK